MNSCVAVAVAELLLGRLDRMVLPDFGLRSTARSWRTRSTLRSVKLLSELPACSKNDQNSIEKKVRISTT